MEEIPTLIEYFEMNDGEMMELFKCFIHTDDTGKISELEHFYPIYRYIEENKYQESNFDPREWGRLYFGCNFVTIIASSAFK